MEVYFTFQSFGFLGAGDYLQHDASERAILCCANARDLHNHAAQHGVPSHGPSARLGQAGRLPRLEAAAVHGSSMWRL